MTNTPRKMSRRDVLKQTTAVGLAAATSFIPMRPSIGQQAKVKVGLLLPYTGTYAALGHNITDAMKLGFAEAGNKLGGREFEIIQVDSEADPAKAAANTNKLIVGAKVDFLSGPHREQSDEQCLREPRCVIETRLRGRAAFARGDPLSVMLTGAWQCR